ncbi:MAG: aryl-sulfate sulfotransferase [Fidelibacterota bacterium]
MSLLCQIEGQNDGYHNYEITINQNPFGSNLFIHTMGDQPRYIAIIDSSLSPSWFINSGEFGLDFKVNQNYLTFFNKSNQNWIVLNDKMKEVDTLNCVNGYKADYHDIQLLQNGGYILQAYDSINVNMSEIVSGGNPNAIVIYLIIQEFDQNKNLIFEWNAWEHLNIADYTNLDLTRLRLTWMHGNSIEVDQDLHLLVSNRRSSEILKIDRNTGDVLWYLGGPNNDFTITNDSFNGFSKQHDVRRLSNGNILLFDNGNEHQPPISRVVEYSVNEINKSINLVWEFYHPEQLLGLAMGSAQRLPNQNTLINWGIVNNNGAIITEVDYDKNIVLEIRYPLGVRCYKVRKEDWFFSTNLIPGDTNHDDRIDILDLNYMTNFIIDNLSAVNTFHLYRYDINKDGIVNESDIDLIVNKIMGTN